jgi:hypothetical protein
MPGFFEDRRGCRAVPCVAGLLAGWQIWGLEAGRCSGGASVSVVEATDLGLGHDPASTRWFDLARLGSIALEGLVRP